LSAPPAAHCLPFLPPCHGMSYIQERTYGALLGPLGEKPTVMAECLFVDPVSDIAVLGEPDGQVLFDECEAYEALVDVAKPLAIGDPPNNGAAWLMSLDARWFRCAVKHNKGPLWLSNVAEEIAGGMSGSPIVADDGSAIGVVCLGGLAWYSKSVPCP